MNSQYERIISSRPEDRRDLFITSAEKMGTNVDNVEKDFWVCWMIDVLFNGLSEEHPRLLFKGGTSLSKAFGLISRFSEDIDITVFRDDLGVPSSIEELEQLSGKKRRLRLDTIKASCQEYIDERLLPELRVIAQKTFANSGVEYTDDCLSLDPDDQDHQSILFRYPSVMTDPETYVRRTVKIESGAKSALDPNRPSVITPYVSDSVKQYDLSVPKVTTVLAERTFWDKTVILHGQRRWFERRGVLRQQGQRVSRHYYDLYCLLNSASADESIANQELGQDCARHAMMFFNSPDYDLASAAPGSFAIVPTEGMFEELRRDYDRMAGMIFGEIPPFEGILAALEGFQNRLNAV